MGGMRRYLLVLAVVVLGGLASAQSTQSFGDVPAGHWAREAINRLVARGVISGFPSDRFEGARTLTRYEAALLIYRVMQQFEAGVLSREDLESISNAMLELRSELGQLGMRIESMVTHEEIAELTRKLALLEANQEGVDLAALQALRSFIEETALTATQALVQSSLALERIQALAGRAQHLERELILLHSRQQSDTQGLATGLTGLRAELQALRQELSQLAGLATGGPDPVQTKAVQLALQQQEARLGTLEQALARLEREQAARLSAHEARLRALEEAQRSRFSLESSLAWRQGYGYALGQEGPATGAERVLGRLHLATEQGGQRFGLSLYSGGGVGFTAVGLEAALGGLAVQSVWAEGGEYAYALSYRLVGRSPVGTGDARTPGGEETYLVLRGNLASGNLPIQLGLPRIEAELQGQWRVSFAEFSRLAFAARLGREASGAADSDYLLAGASPCVLESSLLAGGLGLDLVFGYRGWLRYSQLEERTAPGCATPLLLLRPVLEARLYNQGFLTTDLSFRQEGHRGTGLGQTFTRNVLEGEAGFRFAFGQAQLVPAVGYSRIWFSDVQGEPGLWPSTEVDHPGRGDRETYRFRLGFSGRFNPVRLEAELLWRNTLYPGYTTSQYGGKGALIWDLRSMQIILEGGYYSGNNLNLLAFRPLDVQGVSSSLGWLGVRLVWPEGEVSYASDTAGGIRFGLRYRLSL